MKDLYKEVTDKIIAELESGVVPWLKPWRDGVGAAKVAPQMPRNAISNREYSGINVYFLWATANAGNYPSGRWLTFAQAKACGGSVRKGEKGTMVIFMRKLLKRTRDHDGTEKEVSIPLMRAYWVFNVAQCDNLPVKITDGKPMPPAAELDSMFQHFTASTGAEIKHGGDRAYYSPIVDYVQMPHVQAFKAVDGYKATLLHELTHWTGSESRCKREFGKRFGDSAYAVEELVAELGAAFLCAHLGVTGELRHAAYIKTWLQVLKDDKRAIFTAASKASQAADYLRKFSETTAEETDNEESETEERKAA